MRKNDNERDFAAEFLARREQDPAAAIEAGETIDLSGTVLEDLRPESDPRHEFHEELRRQAGGTDPAPHVSDAELYRAWTEQRESENG